jgi:hypothetical protein
MEMSRCMCMLTGSVRLADITRYTSDSLRMLRNNLNTPDYIKKVDAFFEYAKHDPDMVHSSPILSTSQPELHLVCIANISTVSES